MFSTVPTPRIYLDNAATSFPKPDAVYDAVDQYQREVGAAAGRGSYDSAVRAHATVTRCRALVAEVLGVAEASSVVLTFNCTDSLNTILHGALQAGDHVVTTEIEHNSVLRPLAWLGTQAGVETTYVPVGPTGVVDVGLIAEAVRPSTKLVALTHASNVTGALQPIADAGEIAHKAGALFLVDAAQTSGQIPINMGALPIDFLACAGHKSLLGPLGTGLLCFAPGAEEHVNSLRQGGTGSVSESAVQPDRLPDKFESGNLNMPAIAGLVAGLEFVKARGVTAIRQHEQALVDQLTDELDGIAGIRLFGPGGADQAGVQSLSIDGMEPQVVATILDQTFGIETRSGLHCAPGAHKALGTIAEGGTVRLSVGPFSTAADITAASAALKQIAAG